MCIRDRRYCCIARVDKEDWECPRTSAVPAARAAVPTGAWVKSKHDMYLIRGSLGAKAPLLSMYRRIKKQNKKKHSLQISVRSKLLTVEKLNMFSCTYASVGRNTTAEAGHRVYHVMVRVRLSWR